MKKRIALLILIALCLFNYLKYDSLDQNPFLVTDYSRLHPVKVERVVEGKEEDQLINLVKEATEKKLTISIAGQRHSQGGHTYYKDGILVDMTHFNKIMSIHPEEKKIRVQAGATWKDVQDAINPYGLSVKTMQSQNIFTVGGSISINAHGRDIRNGSLIKSVDSFRLLTADGQIRQVSRTENSDLFTLALGGYGLFGLILDVTLTLTEDAVYRVTTNAITVEGYTEYFRSKVKSDPDNHLHLARISVAPDSFLTDMYTINYRIDRSVPLHQNNTLKNREDWVIPTKILFHLNRSFDWGKNSFWSLQQYYFSKQQDSLISRNNAMRSESQFMEYKEAGQNDLLQEYFVPIHEFTSFTKSLKSVLDEEDLHILNITVRYVTKDEEAMLSYAREDMFALVCLFHTPLSDPEQVKTKQGIQKILDAVIRHQGTYYLPYAAYPSQKQFQTVYPKYKEFFIKKNQYDPDHLFMNYFYEQYKGE
ncbi:FAD-binding oxidoreductase [Brevibacterium sp. JNUCC-42]|nr:FAD-binding oxidoreductase [Brevibacterium sp. JNUCC-42]